MIYCLNTYCPNPQNLDANKFCVSCGTKLVPLLIGRYRLIEPIGEGGFAKTYLAEDVDNLNERCVVKQFAPQARGSVTRQKATQLFEEEALRLQQIGEHPQIPGLYAYFVQNGQFYLVQQFVEGQNLLQELQGRGEETGRPFTEQEILELLTNLLSVLQFVHETQVIHKNIKLENIIRRQSDGRLVLIDFGVSKHLSAIVLPRTATTIGSLGYTPLEQIEGGEVYPASDLYSLGASCFHLLSGIHPWELWKMQGYGWVGSWRQQWRCPVSPELGLVLDKLLQVDLQQRYQSAQEVLNDLDYQWRSPRLIVSQQGRGDYRTIGEAIAIAQSGTRILVQPGLYNESLILNKPVEIIGNGSAAEIIIESTDSNCIVMQTDYAVVRGVTLRGRAGLKEKAYCTVDIPQGELVVEECDITSDSLSCVTIHGSTANPIIRRCKIHDSAESGVFVCEDGGGTVEDCDIFENAYAGVAINQGGNPIVRRCQIRDGKEEGVYVYENGKGTVEDCDISGNASAGVTISAGGSPVIRRSQIRSGKSFGVHVYKNGEGTVEDCDISGNALAGVSISSGGNPVICRCNINGNEYEAVWVHDNGAGTVEDCDLTGNVGGAWDIEAGCQVQCSGNSEPPLV